MIFMNFFIANSTFENIKICCHVSMENKRGNQNNRIRKRLNK